MRVEYFFSKLRIALFAFMVMSLVSCIGGSGFTISRGDAVGFMCRIDAPVVSTATMIFEKDLHTVLGASLCMDDDNPSVAIVLYDDPLCKDDPDISALKGKHEGFVIKLLESGTLLVAGSDPHGAAFGLMELSGMLGVSPWEWWADSKPVSSDRFVLKKGFLTNQVPTVKYRGIFINDEDFALNPWAWKQLEKPAVKGQIGPATNERIFELLLRLKANSYWPAMHSCSVPFFLTEGNRELAHRYGIYIGTSHCEPMASNANGEWFVRGKGEYDFIANRDNVLDFWRERVEEISSQEIIYTLGMRGIHDGPMAGADTPEEQKQALSDVITAQRNMLSEILNKEITGIPQVFIPYKEVLLAYNEGLTIPDDVMLMWCDDNYGYIRHFPTEEERSRKGGNGIYYHVSYWGRPHDYLWLGTFSPALLFQQMSLAYDKGIRDMWILNVGDIKPAEYQIELFMDMAWDMEAVRSKGWVEHMRHFLSREFGERTASAALPLMLEHYRLAYIRKPEFMGNTREEESDPIYRKVKDLEWDEETIRTRLKSYENLFDRVEALSADVSDESATAFYQLVQYPVQAAAKMNEKALTAQLARHGLAGWDDADEAYDAIQSLTARYNVGKWDGMMNAAPRGLPVFRKYAHESVDGPVRESPDVIASFNAVDSRSGKFVGCEELGHEGGAALMPVGERMTFRFWSRARNVRVSVRFVPTHPVSGSQMRFRLSVDGGESVECSYQTYDRSEEWKENVLNNEAVRNFDIALDPGFLHVVKIEALDEGEILDRVIVMH